MLLPKSHFVSLLLFILMICCPYCFSTSFQLDQLPSNLNYDHYQTPATYDDHGSVYTIPRIPFPAGQYWSRKFKPQPRTQIKPSAYYDHTENFYQLPSNLDYDHYQTPATYDDHGSVYTIPRIPFPAGQYWSRKFKPQPRTQIKPSTYYDHTENFYQLPSNLDYDHYQTPATYDDHGSVYTIPRISFPAGQYWSRKFKPQPRTQSKPSAYYDHTKNFDLTRFDRMVAASKLMNVDDFGAKGRGADDNEMFMKAWEVACASEEGVVLVVPKNRQYHLKPITFSGPCKSDITVKIYGTIKASNDISDYKKDRRHWLRFDNIDNLIVEGGGTINGNGKIWWQNSCKIDKTKPCLVAPTAVSFYECKNLKVNDLRTKNAQKMHIAFQKCVNVVASNLMVIAPRDSPNTDGIHVTDTQNIQIKSCVIRTGDDCISIVSGSRNVQAVDITCGPGHGISIGSLGAAHSGAYVSDVMVNRAKLTGTTNGVRIKTWQGGSGYAKNILFQNVVMDNVSNPIIIDQNYCDQVKPCAEQKSAVQVSNVVYTNIKGTSATEMAIKLNCSESVPCRGILLQDINLVQEAKEESKASCVNVKLAKSGSVFPLCS
ncbi:polygalacturonase QRT2-like [Malania oleifera]|uniref:polygalacturonase QRT2-like n=1 Tax=Malania oleifera TaxID=397392 RepID=UPI0025ADF08D|nr:polygalacturonase QRT2-like [Malania oleifera]